MGKPSKKYRTIGIILGIILGFVIVDFIVGYRQDRFLDEKKALRKKLERLAWYSLQSNIEDVVYTPDKKYRFVLRFENPLQDELYIKMPPNIRVFIQVGIQWKEVAIEDLSQSGDEGTVIKLVEKKTVEKIVEINTRNFTELIPYYMHVWVSSTSFVAFESEPKDIVEKTEPYYIYLKPYYVKDSQVLTKLHYEKVPIWIPMPPH